MNPVDHVRSLFIYLELALTNLLNSPTVVVTINISAKRPPSQDTPLKVKKLVSLLLGGQVCFVVHRRQRTRGVVGCIVDCGMPISVAILLRWP
jgi:hypothetical protein